MTLEVSILDFEGDFEDLQFGLKSNMLTSRSNTPLSATNKELLLSVFKVFMVIEGPDTPGSGSASVWPSVSVCGPSFCGVCTSRILLVEPVGKTNQLIGCSAKRISAKEKKR